MERELFVQLTLSSFFLEIKLFCLKIYTRFKRLITIVSNAILNNFTLTHLNIYLFLRILEVAHAAIL